MFTSQPEPFASFREELIFEYSQEEETDLSFDIELGDEEESFEVKKLYDVSNAKINVAHIVANRFMTAPSQGESAIETPDSGWALVKMKCGEEQTEAQYFVAAQVEMPEVGVISSMPTSRLISYAECEEVWIRAEEGSTIEVDVEYSDEGGTYSQSFEAVTQGCELVRFRFNTADFGIYTKMAKLSIYCNGESVGEMVYYYISRDQGAVRLAWIGAYGAIEHYTFPVTNTLTLFKNGVMQYEVESAYEPQSTVSALSEILQSERVWIVEEDIYTEVQITSDTVVVNKNGELATVEYKIERYD